MEERMTNINLLNQLQMAHTIAWFTYSLFWQSSHCHDELDLHLFSWRRAKGCLLTGDLHSLSASHLSGTREGLH